MIDQAIISLQERQREENLKVEKDNKAAYL